MVIKVQAIPHHLETPLRREGFQNHPVQGLEGNVVLDQLEVLRDSTSATIGEYSSTDNLSDKHHQANTLRSDEMLMYGEEITRY